MILEWRICTMSKPNPNMPVKSGRYREDKKKYESNYDKIDWSKKVSKEGISDENKPKVLY
jgi:hypothetical protein